MKLEWMNVTVDVQNTNKLFNVKRVRLIDNACGYVTQGLIAVMGPSGCGKTTLLSTLAGRMPKNTKTSGCVLYNGQKRGMKTWLTSIGFVDQNSAFFESLTAYETVYYVAKLKLKRPHVNIRKKITDLFIKLRIIDIITCKVQVISDGERKRVMIAAELISDPKIIFLDEPASGLDNDVAFNIITFLKELAGEGKLIMISIHQPDDRLCLVLNDIILMSHGRIITSGTMFECKNFLIHNGYKQQENATFSSFAMEVLSDILQRYNENSDEKDLSILANVYRKQFNCEGKYESSRVRNDFCVEWAPSLNDISVLMLRRMKLGLIRKKTFILYGIMFVLVGIVFSLRIPERMFDTELNLFAKTSETSHSLTRLRKWLYLIIILQNSIPLCIISSFTLISVFRSERKIIQREIYAHSYTIVSYHISTLLFELLYHSPFILCYLAITLYKYCPIDGIFLCISFLLLTYGSIMNFGFMLISIFHGHGETIGCFIAGMLIYGSSFLDVDLFMVPDKTTNLTHISTITYILSLLPASFLLAYLQTSRKFDPVLHLGTKNASGNIVVEMLKKRTIYFKCLNLVFFSKYPCLTAVIISNFIILGFSIIFNMRLLSPRMRLKLSQSN